MTEINIYGRGEAFAVYEVSAELAVDLAEGRLTEDDFFDLLSSETLPLLVREGGLTGDVVVEVDGKRVKHPFPAIDFSDEYDVKKDYGDPSKCYLFVSTNEKGNWYNLEIDENFDSSKLKMTRIQHSVRGKKFNVLSEVDYDGEMDLGETVETSNQCLILYASGDIYEVQFADDPEDDEED